MIFHPEFVAYGLTWKDTACESSMFVLQMSERATRLDTL